MSDQQITLSQLEGHLWESANILRGPVDAADFKTYIFPLLFFKRICDVWESLVDSKSWKKRTAACARCTSKKSSRRR